MVRPHNKKVMERSGQTDPQAKNHSAELQDDWSCIADEIDKTSEDIF